MGKAAAQLERFSHFLENTDGEEALRSVEEFARKRPLLFLGGAVALGFGGARFLKSSERRGGRYGGEQRFGRERSFGYTGYNQPYTRDAEIGGSYTGSERDFGGGYEGGYGGGNA